MDFVNKISSSLISNIVFIGLFILGALLFLNLLPVLLLVGIGIYGTIKGVKLFKQWKSSKTFKWTSKETIEEIVDEKDYFDMTDKNVIDVEYTETK